MNNDKERLLELMITGLMFAFNTEIERAGVKDVNDARKMEVCAMSFAAFQDIGLKAFLEVFTRTKDVNEATAATVPIMLRAARQAVEHYLQPTAGE